MQSSNHVTELVCLCCWKNMIWCLWGVQPKMQISLPVVWASENFNPIVYNYNSWFDTPPGFVQNDAVVIAGVPEVLRPHVVKVVII